MTKKQKVHLTSSEELEAVDTELDSAMGALDSVNAKVAGLLETIDNPSPEPDAEAGGASEDGAADETEDSGDAVD